MGWLLCFLSAQLPCVWALGRLGVVGPRRIWEVGPGAQAHAPFASSSLCQIAKQQQQLIQQQHKINVLQQQIQVMRGAGCEMGELELRGWHLLGEGLGHGGTGGII